LSWFESSATEFVSMWVGTLDPLGTLTHGACGPPVAASCGLHFAWATTARPCWIRPNGLTFWSTNEYIGVTAHGHLAHAHRILHGYADDRA
jgi:hypothetical protein